ncbi:tetraspanin-11 [Tripterygium wilfordii]|uniref:Tetraspanin-11 n=1 Tax=Tripterygium wilfordii TaxID=458696 RepID=A0A7J7CJB9_TRIWF|nr:tetraspanin-11-like [Tripterygium wilfordii]KAF5734096.1 tetraspanin-11 [Tripterygium wilfordii]
MARISNTVVAIVNGITLLIGLGIAGLGVYLLATGSSNCHKAIQTPLMVTGLVLFVVSLLGFLGSCCRNNFAMVVYLALMFLLIVGLIVFTVFVFLVTNQGAGEVVSEKGFKEYKTADLKNWLGNYFVRDGKKWEGIKSCLTEGKVCGSLGSGGGGVDETASEFYKKNLSPIQSGCCKPPSDCGFEFKNATYWIRPKTGPAVKDSDCKTWSNEQQTLCYNCNSCKGGVLTNIRKEWRQLLIFNGIAIVVTIIVYTVGCCARNNNRIPKKYGYRAYP